jgi:hypothetical protein
MTIFVETGRYAVLSLRRLEESVSWILLQSWHIRKRLIPCFCPPLSVLPPPTYLSDPTQSTSIQKRSITHFIVLKHNVRVESTVQTTYTALHFHGICGKLSVEKHSVIDSSWTDYLTSLIDIIYFNFESSQQLVSRLKKSKVPCVNAIKACKGK